MKTLEVVNVTKDLPRKGPRIRRVGSIAEHLAPHVYEGESSRLEGKRYATADVADALLIRLIRAPMTA